MRKLIFILLSIIILSCNNKPKPVESSMVEIDETNINFENMNELLVKSSPYTRDSSDFFGVEALVFDENTVRFSVASLYALGQIVDREDITGSYDISSNGNVITVELDFNTNFVFLDYLIDGSSTGGKSIKEVNVPYIIKGTKTKDGLIVLKDWENSKQKEERLKREETEQNKEKIVEDYGIDKNTILGRYKGVSNDKEVIVTIADINPMEITENRKSGMISGRINAKGIEKDFETEYETFHPGNRYSFSVEYSKDKWQRPLGILFTYKNGLEANFFSDSGPSKRFGLDRMKNTDVEESVSSIQYYKINDPDGYSNLRDKPKGNVIRKVLENEKFQVIATEDGYKQVKLFDGTIGYIHSSRIVEY